MSRQPKEYKRLAKGRPFVSSSALGEAFSLWIGKDHLLLVSREQYTETYKRFFFKDIQAIALVRTNTASIFNMILGAITLIFGIGVVIGLVEPWEPAATVIVALIGFALLVGLIVSLWRGSSCECYIHTSVQTERLHPLRRLKSATRVLQTIREAVEAVQGPLSPEEAAKSWTARLNSDTTAATPAGERPATRTSRPAIPVAEKMAYYSGWAHMVVFSCLLADFVDTALQWFIKNGVLGTGVSLALLAVVFIHIVIGLIKQHGSRVSRDLKIATWTTLAYIIAGFLLANGRYFYLLITEGDLADAVGSESPTDSVGALALNIFSMAGSGILGVFGWIETIRSRRQQRTPPALPVPPPLPEATPGSGAATPDIIPIAPVPETPSEAATSPTVSTMDESPAADKIE